MKVIKLFFKERSQHFDNLNQVTEVTKSNW